MRTFSILPWPLFLRSASTVWPGGALALACLTSCTTVQEKRLTADVIIYGGTPGGIAAATAVVREGLSVIVVEPTTHIGGMVTGGISRTDTPTPQLVGGIAGEFFGAIAAENRRLYPSEKPPTITFRGRELPWRLPAEWDFEPKIAREVFDRWIQAAGYHVLKGRRVESVERREGRITAIRLTDGTILPGKVFIDASYEGDLMARAGVSYTWGREARSDHGEKLAGVQKPHFRANYAEADYAKPTIGYMHHGQFGAELRARDQDGKLLWGVEPGPLGEIGSADRRIQAFCYRLIATQRRDLLVPWPKPRHYEPRRYELLLQYIHAHPDICFTRLVHLTALPNGKYDLNASGPFSTDYVGGNVGFPDATYSERERMLRDHEDYQKGFLWFLANDPRVPQALRDEAASWGLPRDEFVDSDNWPVQLYIRESRRMQGDYIMTEHDILTNRQKADSVGMGSFVLDSHWVRRFETPEGSVRVEGHLDESYKVADNPYEIPYRSLTPKAEECRNLLVPVCVSATHVAICTIRMEPVYMVLGHSAGVAAALAVKSGKPVQEIDVTELRRKLREQDQVMHKEQAVSERAPRK